MHDFQAQCQVHGQRSKNMACRKLTVFGAISHLSLFFKKQCIIKQLLDSVNVISLSPRLRLTSTLIIPDIMKTSSNNCLKCPAYQGHDYVLKAPLIPALSQGCIGTGGDLHLLLHNG